MGAGRARGSAFFKTIVRSVRGSLGRFCAIMGIVALGCGFFAGLQMCGPDMRGAADALYDGTNLYDIRLVSTLGFADKDAARVAKVDGVEAVMPATSCDVMARMGSEQLAVRMSSLDVDAANASKEQGATVVSSDDDGYVNRVFLREGMWPQAADECVITADVDVAGIRVGDTIEVLYGTTELDDVLKERMFRVVGLVSSSNYPYTGGFGSTTLGSGTIGAYAYVSPDAFVDDAPFTELYVCVDGAAEQESGSGEYEAVVDEVRVRLEGQADALARARLQDVREDAQEELDDAWGEYEAEERKANKKLADAKAELDEAKATLDTTKDELERAKAQLEYGEAMLGADALAQERAEYEAGQAAYDEGLAEYEDGLVTYKRQRKKAQKKLADAKQELDDAQADIDAIEEPDIYVLDRSQHEGVMAHNADSHRMDSIADVFPFIFFLVAALVSLTTMTRMVDDDRKEIGTYKALGYSTARIASKYLLYVGAASVVGAAVGIAVLCQALPYIVMSSYGIIYTVPMQELPFPVDVRVVLLSGGLGVGVTLLATWAAVVASLRETPATLMLPRAPASGKRILLERIGPVWRHLSFSWKVTCRNLFRYKRRLAMTVIGISGCTALLLTGFGLHDAIWDIIDGQYGPIDHFDTTVRLKDEATEDDVQAVVDYLEQTGDVSNIVRLESRNMQAGVSSDDTMLVRVCVPRSVDELEEAVSLRERLSGEPVPFDDDAVVVTEKLCSKYGLAVGDTLRLFEQDAIGNVTGAGAELRITGVAENYVGHLVYVGKDAWGKVEPEEPVFSTIFASVTGDRDVRAGISDGLHDLGDVSTVAFIDETIDRYRNMLSVVDLVVVVLIVSAGLLAFIVLYNLTNINIGERVREIASLKVLGFTRREVYAYIFREILLLSVLGDVLGMVLGSFLATFVVTTAEVDYVMFGRQIHVLSYVWSFAITLGFTVVILALMRGKLDRVDMVESLKSVD